MPTSEEFRSATSSLQELARRYHGFQEEPESFLQYLKSQKDRSELREYLEHIKETQVTVLKNVQQIRPVVFLRRIVVECILAEEPVSAADIQELQERIDARDTEYFTDYPELHDEIANQKERAHSAFNSWDLFKICFGIDYYHRTEQVKEQLRITAEFLQEGLGLSDCDYHRAAFDFNQNFGTDHCWIALYPEEAKGHQAAYQIFFGIRDDHYAHGLIAGGRIDDDLREVEHLSADEEIDTGVLVERLEERIPRFKELNRGLAESQMEEDRREGPIERPLNKILYGPPGTGKTYSVQKRTLQIIEGTVQNLSEDEISERFRGYLEEGRVEFTTFHPSYSYEEFVEGLRYDTEKQVPVVQDGILKKLAKRAADPDPDPHVLIIDEINRGNLSRIFGELVTLLEGDKRKGAANEMSVTLPYSQERFSLPSNLYVLGTMNTADRSIALVDVALRRRFDFEEMMPDAGVIRNRLTALLDEESEEIDLTSDQIDLIVEVFQVVNRRVSYLLDRDHQIGHSYFLEVESMKDLHDVWYSRVLPLLQEYFYNDRRRLVRVLGEHDPEGPMGFVTAGEQVQLLGDGSASGEAGSWGFHEYGVGKLEAALRNTFSS